MERLEQYLIKIKGVQRLDLVAQDFSFLSPYYNESKKNLTVTGIELVIYRINEYGKGRVHTCILFAIIIIEK